MSVLRIMSESHLDIYSYLKEHYNLKKIEPINRLYNFLVDHGKITIDGNGDYVMDKSQETDDLVNEEFDF